MDASVDFMLLSGLLVLTLAGFISGILRYDMVALLTLLTATLLGLVPVDRTFAGLGHPAVVTVAAVLVISQGFFQSGLVNTLSHVVLKAGAHPTFQVLTLTGTVAILSAFMNNVGALALMLPVGVKLARTHGLAPSRLLMPLAFGSLLGGLTTMIGTPPNVIVANFREESTGTPFGLFDFSPVGMVVGLGGILFIGFIGWRLLPDRRGQSSPEDRFEIESYLGELRVEQKSKAKGMTLMDLRHEIEGSPPILAVMRGDHRISAHRFRGVLTEDDVLLVEGETEEIENLAAKAGLAIGFDSKKPGDASDKSEEDQESVPSKTPAPEKALKPAKADKDIKTSRTDSQDLSLAEAVVMGESRLIGRTVADLRLLHQYELNLIAVSRQGRRLTGRLRNIRFQSGDVLLLQGTDATLSDQLAELGCLPLADRGLRLGKPRKMILSGLLFLGAILCILAGWTTAPVALVAAAVLMVVSGVVDLRSAYKGIDWPVLVLLGCMIPVGEALETTGGAAWLAERLLSIGGSWPPVIALALLLLLAMLLSDIVNNAAAAVLLAPIGLNLAQGLEVSPDAFLMAVAIGASCAFLTPIGHQSNILVLGPGGYRFSDYWKLGLPLQIVLFIIAIPMLIWVWPLK